ncbi:MAG: chorismate synthase [Deltaproteobacteria bacterium]|nr:MAG: chorismate synthase [Deltaproteobacteria bacterium]
MGSTFGQLFRIHTFGESHGGALGVVIDGCPPGLTLDLARIQAECDRRRPGQSKLTTGRKELDQVEVLSGLFEGRTLGTSLALAIRNKDADSSAYANFKDTYRPSHADFTYDARYGIRAWAGGGRSSARETAARVAAGAVARQVLESLGNVEVVAWVDTVQELTAAVDPDAVTVADVDSNLVRCPDSEAAALMEARIRQIRAEGDTVGGVVRAVARGVPAGLGDPVFDKLDADLAKAMISLPAAKGFEVGSGFAGTALKGSAHNDLFVPENGGIATTTNRSGGIQGGISNGMPIELAVAFKPVATIFHEQDTVNDRGEATTVRPRGRHDPCVLPRAVPIVEAMMCLVLADHWLRWRGQVGAPPPVPLRS